MFEVTLTMKGERPLIVQSDRGVNPLDNLVREKKKLTGLRKKTDEHHELISRIEFELGLYWDDSLGPYVPTGNIHKALVEGARQSKLGKLIEQGCFPRDVRVPILYEGPREIEALYKSPDHVYTVSVGVSGKRVMKTRPRFPEWALNPTFYLDPDKLDVDVFAHIADVTGRFIGIGERRPGKGGPFGTFSTFVEQSEKGAMNGRAAVHA